MSSWLSSSGREINWRRARVAVPLLVSLACTGERPPSRLVEPSIAAVSGGYRTSLVPAPGARINAALPPALERPDGTVFRFASSGLTVDSAYYTEPPELVTPFRPVGTIRASVCEAGENVCRSVRVVLGEEKRPR